MNRLCKSKRQSVIASVVFLFAFGFSSLRPQLVLTEAAEAASFSARRTKNNNESTESSYSTTPPNIVIFLADNLGYNDIGMFGAATAQTPNIDRLGHEGMKFTHWNSAAHLCSASRASLLTGQYYPRLGIYPGVFHPDATMGLMPPPIPFQENKKHDHSDGKPTTTIAAALKERGYATSIVGKWHLGHNEPFLPTHHGFDEWLGIPYHMSGGSVDNHTCMMDVNETMWLPLYHNDQIVQQPVQLDDLASRYAQQAVDFMTRLQTTPDPSAVDGRRRSHERFSITATVLFVHVLLSCSPTVCSTRFS